jgi:ribosomal protein L11 methyltransferase
MAFGTGTHPTTQLCLEAVEEYVQPGYEVADLGCGTGILAIGAALMGAARVEAWEIDAMAAGVARANLRDNGVADRVHVREGDGLDLMVDRYEFVVANIHTQFLLRLIPRLPGLLKPGGRAALSGTTETSGPALAEALEQSGLVLVERKQSGEWLALLAACSAE